MLWMGTSSPEPDPAVPEYFFLLSYSSLLSVVYRLEQIREHGGRATLFCFTEPLARFFSPLQELGWVKILLIDSMLTRPPSFLSLRSIAGARRRLAELQERYFEQIPDGSLVHFYNRHYSTLAANVLAQLHKRCNVAYTECDPVGLPKTAYGPKAAAYWLVHTAIYRAPIRMVGRQRPFQELREAYIREVVTYLGHRVTDPDQVRMGDVYQKLWVNRFARVLWVLGNHLTRNLVHRDLYLDIIRRCVQVVGASYPASTQVVKYHPYAEQFEDIWPAETQVLPAHVPSQFINLQGVELILTLSTTSSFPISDQSDSVHVVSLLGLVPFNIENARNRFVEELSNNLGRRIDFPASVEELRAVIAQHPAN